MTRWPCLMYHEVPRGPEAAGYFAVPAERFAAHLDMLRGLGLDGCSLEAALARLPARVVAITFDDGHATHYASAFPLLAERGMTATFFVTSSWVGTPGYLSWDQVREMAAAGMSIQSHTATHPFLSELGRAAAEAELADSRAAIERETGRPCTTLALPGGDAPRGFAPSDYARLGFRCVATSRHGPNTTGPAAAGAPEAAFVRRYTVRRGTPDAMVRRMAVAEEPAYGLEGLRQAVLHSARSALGATRYARWRRRALAALGR